MESVEKKPKPKEPLPGAVQEDQPKSGITFRGLLIGLVFVALTCVVVTYAELVLKEIQIGFLQMPPAVIGMFFFMILLNRGMRSVSKRLALSASEMMMIYVMMLVAAMISSRGVMEKVIPLLVTVNYYSDSSNMWSETFGPYIKKWMVAFDPDGPNQQPVAKLFFEGLRNGEQIPWQAWAVPLTMWAVLVGLVIFAFLCLASMLRKQWVDNEKLTFPLVQLPLELARTDGGQDILKNKLLWGGMAVPVIVFTVNGLHNTFPAIPQVTLSLYINSLITTPPWSEMYWTSLYLSFAAIGFFFLLPTELLFSLWFFAVFVRLEDIVMFSYGLDMRRMPSYGTYLYQGYQTAGAYVVLAAYLLWVAMPHLKNVARIALTRQKEREDSDELLPYGTAFWGLIISFGLILLWCKFAGMSPWVALLEFFVFLFVVALVMARSTAEAGMLMTETSFRPADLYRMFASTTTLGPANLTILAFLDTSFLREQRGLLLTGILDGLKIADGSRTKRSSMRWVFLIGILAAMLVAGAYHLWLPYTKGGMNLYSYAYHGNNFYTFREYEGQIAGGASPDWMEKTFFLVGAAVTVFLTYMRARYFWWPFHPLGYALCVSWTLSVFWFSCLIAWLFKVMILRYGGMKLFVKARPWFLGMVLGEFGMAVIWALISALTGAVPPTFPWP